MNYKAAKDDGHYIIRYSKKITFRNPTGKVITFDSIKFKKENPNIIIFCDGKKEPFFVRVEFLRNLKFANSGQEKVFFNSLEGIRATNSFTESVKDYLILLKGEKK